ncbi:CopD family protein [Methylocapsa polymorpha]|uniref:CopD family protein n=1 Tax=Methylocapsa polymorpha TaxID=3080828 RepID=A0ABZ0HNJ9_9HYPH|nr:CopD family protein [Methylocapsa sp. RX1]
MTIFQILVAAAHAAEDAQMDNIQMEGMHHHEVGGLLTIFDVLVIARWIHFASVFVLFGSSFFWFYMGHERLSSGPGGLPRAFRATIILLRVAAPAAAITGAAWLAGVLANMTGGFSNVVDPETLRLFFFETEFGPVAMVRLALLAAAVGIAALPWHGRVWLSTLLHIGAFLLITQAWLGHAAEGGAGLYGAIMIVSYCVHVLATAAWVGGLPPLLFALVEQRRFNLHEARDWTLDILSRYSLMAMTAVAFIVLSGTANAAFRVAGSFGKLFYTDYGNVLFAKIGLVAVMLVLAWFNRFVAMPRLRGASLKGMSLIVKLRTSVAFELLLGLLVLGVAAILGITPPPQ